MEVGRYINNFKMKGGKSIYKYGKATRQKKFHLLTLVLHQKLLIKQAARIVGINYSTAKTIMFFNRNHNLSYLFSFRNPAHSPSRPHPPQAHYKQLTSPHSQLSASLPQFARVGVVSSIGCQKMACRSQVHRQSSSGNAKKCIKEDSNDLFQEYVEEQKHLGSLKLERPRTRSQLALLYQMCHSDTEEHLIESNGLPQREQN